jgi:hypothetical protein
MTPRHLLVVGLFLVASASTLRAAPPLHATAQADHPNAQVGQPISVTVKVRGADAVPEVKTPTVNGITLQSVGPPTVKSAMFADLEAQGVLHSGGANRFADAFKSLKQATSPEALKALDPEAAKLLSDPALTKGLPDVDAQEYTFTYSIQAEKPGQYVVPAFVVNSGGQTTTTNPIPLNLTETKPQPWVQVALSLSNSTPLVGEEVQLYYDLLIERANVTVNGKAYPYLPVGNMSLTLPALDGSTQFEMAKPLDQFIQDNAIEAGKRGFRVNGHAPEVKLDHEPDGQAPRSDNRYRRRLVIPLRIRAGGTATISPAKAAGDVYVPAGGKAKWESFVAVSQPLTFTALDLRNRADRPGDFSGIVGKPKVSAQASQTRMAAGTPFTLTLRVEGNSSTQAVAPNLAAQPEIIKGFRVRHENDRDAGDNAREFLYTLRPLNEDVKEVPPIAVSYYDPRGNAFGVAQSAAIPLTVTPSVNVTPDQPQTNPTPTPATAEPSAPTPAKEPAPPATTWSDRLLAGAEIALGLGTAVCLAVVGVRYVRRRRALHKQRTQLRQAVAEVKLGLGTPTPTVAEIRRVVQDFLRRTFHLPQGEVTPADAEECLRQAGVPVGLIRSCVSLLETCATAEFAPGMVAESPTELNANARRLLEQIALARK